jgi:two-component system chemotaxis response regulator CheY
METTIMRVLVIDDSRAMRSILRNIIKSMGFDVVEAVNGKEAVQKVAAAGPFDLALVDWNMPEMNGLEFVSAVRAKSEYNAMLIMMVTTEVEMSQVSRALAAGANEYVMKPFTPEILKDKIGMLGLCQV